MTDYDFYTNVYHGNQIAEQDFLRFITRAGVYLDNLKLNADEEKLKMATCAVAEAWQVNEQGGDVLSQTVGSWSKSYVQGKPKTNEQRLLDAVKLYLGSAVSVRWV